MKPLVIELYAGLFGWGAGFVAEGYRSIGFDLFKMGPVPEGCELVLQDVLTLHGSQFKDAAIIVGSSPCQEFSYRAMPFKRGKALGPPLLGMELFQAQFRIQKEASEAAGHHIPMVVENVRGAQPWVGRAAWHYGSYYLFGDVPALMPFTLRGQKNSGGSWLRIDGSGKSGERNDPRYDENIRNGHNPVNDEHFQDGVKLPNNGSARMWRDRELPRLNAVNKHEDGYSVAVADGTKQGGDWVSDPQGMSRQYSSHSAAGKAASAQIAKIPFALAQHIAQVYKPVL